MNILIDKLHSEIPNWKNIISSIQKEDSSGERSLREGEREVFQELKEFWKYNDFNPNHAKDLINELKKHEPYHAPKWDELGEFRRVCVQYYTKDKSAFDAFQQQLGGKNSGDNILSNSDGDFCAMAGLDDLDAWAADDDGVEYQKVGQKVITLSIQEILSIGNKHKNDCDMWYFNIAPTRWNESHLSAIPKRYRNWLYENIPFLEDSLNDYTVDLVSRYQTWLNGSSCIVLLRHSDLSHQVIFCANDNKGSRTWRILNPYDSSRVTINWSLNNESVPVYTLYNEMSIKKYILEDEFIHNKLCKILITLIDSINSYK